MTKSISANLIKKIAISISLFFVFIFFAASNVSAQGSYNFANESGISKTGGKAGYDLAATPEPEKIISNVIVVILGLVGIIFLAFMLYAGITWMTAQGDEKKATKAKSMLEEAIVGIIIVLAAYAISSFVIDYFRKPTIVAPQAVITDNSDLDPINGPVNGDH
ncbi:MAG: pilin [Patescibacteria group bacterium]